jgi:D-3-phosphoglycerate dehydrogenase
MTVLIAESAGFSPVALRRLRERVDVVQGDFGRHELLAAVASADVLWVRLRNQIDEEVLAAAVRLKAIVTNTTGLTHIDVDAARRRGIHVISLRGEVAFLKTVRATAELTLGLVLALVRRLPAAAAHVRDGGWDRYGFKGHDLYEKTAGIVGLGRLGRIVATYFQALGMSVLATTPENESAAGVPLVSLDELLARADLVSVHVDLNPGTRALFGPREYATMKPGAWFVNTSRGEVVDEKALLVALEGGALQGAALDVLAGEPTSITPSHPLVRYAATHDNLIITPHIGGYTFESLDRTECHLAGALLQFLDRLPLVPVNDTRDTVPPTPTEV